MRFVTSLLLVLFSVFFINVANTKVDATATSVDNNSPKLYEQVIDHLKQQETATTKPLPKVSPPATIYNAEAIIPPMCYTKTDGEHNPCYVCHQNPVSGRENTMADGGLQIAYAFSDVGMKNHWKNLFEDRSEAVAKISDEEIIQWVAEDNYSDLPKRLKSEGFKGWIPDLKNLQRGAKAFDKNGFAKDGSQWVAFNYKPLPSTFWPTNGSTDDVMIRLPEAFRQDVNGEHSLDIYAANLAIVEANIKGLKQISTIPVDEKAINKDLNGDGSLTEITEISVTDSFVGAAEDSYIDPYMYPAGTEFLHTVRYLGFDKNGDITISKRMKEVRYMKKWKDVLKQSYKREYQLENFAKEAGQLPSYVLAGDWGLDNGFSWSIQGFIEDAKGNLRESTYEENLFCMGCHTSIGATIDKTFSFARKVDGAQGWGYIDLKGMPDAPNMGETKGEIATYLERVGGGGEFRSNPEMQARFFNAEGKLDHQAIKAARDVYDLIVPSRERALTLNKAYKAIVDEQDFLYGRDATVTPPVNVYDFIDNDTAPTLPANLFHQWDIRLDWSHQDNHQRTAEKNLKQ